MKRRPDPPAIDLAQWETHDDFTRNRQLLEWLSHDERRAQLYEAVNGRGGVLAFPSIAREPDPDPTWRHPPDTAPRQAFLITGRAHIERALANQGEFSNSPYADLGTGGFMLAIDKVPGPGAGEQPSEAHKASARRDLQVDAARRVFDLPAEKIGHLCRYAFRSTTATALRGNAFDLADLAEQAALRFSSALFGFAASDYPLLEDALRKGYRALNHQLLGRHFANEPLTLPDARLAMGRLLARTAVLIDEYQWNDARWPEDVGIPDGDLASWEPLIKRLGTDPGPLSGEERAVLVVGSLVGIVGNVQASVCIAMEALLRNEQRDRARRLVSAAEPDGGPALWALLAEGLRLNPPVAFLPRRATRELNLEGSPIAIPADADCLLAMGGATRGDPATLFDPDTTRQDADALVFGLDPRKGHAGGVHWCLGRYLAQPLIQRVCAEVLCLDSLAEQLDPGDGDVVGLDKLWGFKCRSYPLQHRRDLRIVQQPLNVVMRIKAPIAANAEALRGVIRYGAPRIEHVLAQSRHVHFAWFEFIEDDTKLVLHTVFDGDFNAYLQHFALVVGDVFDRLFRYIEDAPPLPVDEFPLQFVEVIRRFHRPAAEGFFFSAYPKLDAARIRFHGARPL